MLTKLLILLFVARISNAWFENCDQLLEIQQGFFIQSQFYPGYYPPKSSCRYHLIAPLDTQITLTCQLNLPKFDQGCVTDQFYVNTDGDRQLRNPEVLCGTGSIKRTSLFNKMTFAYTSSSQTYSGRFSCTVNYTQSPCDCGWSMRKKIVGGTEVTINELPSMAAVFNSDNIFFCAANIIHRRYLASAAHCFDAHIPYKVSVGDHDLTKTTETQYTQWYFVQRAIKHENYNPNTNDHDIGLIQTKQSMEWSMAVGPICLPFLYSKVSFVGADADLAGWGSQSFAGPKSNVLLKTTVKIVDNSVCKNYYADMTPEKLCSFTYSKDACQLDSGGPVIYRSQQRLQLIGIISYGKDCGNSPGVNSRITSYLPWIQLKIGIEGLCIRA